MHNSHSRGTAIVLIIATFLTSLASCRMNVKTSRSGDNERPQQLFRAVETGRQDDVRQLLEKHPNWVNRRSDLGNTPLFVAAFHGRSKIAEILLQAGANPHATGTADMSPLHAAALGGHDNVLQLLLTAGAKTNAQDRMGRTPLHYAAQEGHASVADSLLKAGADRLLADHYGQTPLDLARIQDHAGIVDLLTHSAAQRQNLKSPASAER